MVAGLRYTTLYRDEATTSATWSSWSSSSSTASDSTTWNNWNTVEWEPRQEVVQQYDGSVWVRWTMQPVSTPPNMSNEEYMRQQQQAEEMMAQQMQRSQQQYQQQVWGNWNNATTDTSYSTTTSANGEWQVWVAEYDGLRGMTTYQDGTRESDEARAEREAREQERKREKVLAKKRAEALLKSVLNEEELEEYEAHKTITVKVDAIKKLRFKVGRVKNVEELDAQGNVKAELCVHVRDQVPDEDNVLAQLLFAKTDLEGFYAMANRYER